MPVNNNLNQNVISLKDEFHVNGNVEKHDFLEKSTSFGWGLEIYRKWYEYNISDLCEVFCLWQTIQSVIQMDNKMVIASHWKHLVIPCEKGPIKTEWKLYENCVYYVYGLRAPRLNSVIYVIFFLRSLLCCCFIGFFLLLKMTVEERSEHA